MRRQTELRRVTRDDTGKSVAMDRKTGSGTHRSKAASTAGIQERKAEMGVFAPLWEMERWFEESMSRPFFGMNWTPFRNVFHELGGYAEVIPAVDMFEEGNHLVVKAELPGITKDNLNLQIVDNSLIISGEKSTEEKVERSNYLRLERSHGSFSRTLSLPDGLDVEQIKAIFRDGVLEIRIPRTETSTVRQIAVE